VSFAIRRMRHFLSVDPPNSLDRRRVPDWEWPMNSSHSPGSIQVPRTDVVYIGMPGGDSPRRSWYGSEKASGRGLARRIRGLQRLTWNRGLDYRDMPSHPPREIAKPLPLDGRGRRLRAGRRGRRVAPRSQAYDPLSQDPRSACQEPSSQSKGRGPISASHQNSLHAAGAIRGLRRLDFSD
jgi:hypothetical protein